ncbi:MAG: hypothetical protein AAFV53_32185 [Myxococcota bacterium]
MSQIDEQILGTDVFIPADPNGQLGATPTGDLQLVSGRDNLGQALGRRLRVRPGGLLHRAGFGVGVMGLLERANDPTNRAQLANRGRRNFLRDPRVSEARFRVEEGRPGDTEPTPDAVTISAEVEIRYDRTPITVTLIQEV